MSLSKIKKIVERSSDLRAHNVRLQEIFWPAEKLCVCLIVNYLIEKSWDFLFSVPWKYWRVTRRPIAIRLVKYNLIFTSGGDIW